MNVPHSNPDPVAGLRFCKGSETDSAALAELARSAHSHPWKATQYRDSMASGHDCWLLRTESGGIAACCVASRLFDEVEILDVAVAPEWRRKGVGESLLQRIIAQLPEDTARMILEVRASNRAARGLYHKLGFSEDGRRKNYYPKADGTREDALLMSLVL
ncbi:ribosomal protein S18-alanine N-acetyltransferase [Microbulbifer aggregans]|uniref:ribosomal protein S18-alanine N-acetyltransferase n=1 Tax=Microbulbifer aggregans TaxID=1769779 RepID=UPI001CFD33AB|nr:ribosomal protein S18-alanine N-acetyltransferase [Microbulbifer aggregans]